VRIRTVLDAGPGAPRRYVLQTLFLAHSWAAFSSRSPLEVVVIGDAPASVVGRLCELGVEVVSSAPHPLDRISKPANKLLALRHPSDVPVLLVDNDVCFLEDVSDLSGRGVCASIAGKCPVTEAQWERIEQATGLRPLAVEWVPLREQVDARRARRPPKPEQRLYLNSGVVLVRRPFEFEATWAAHIDAIAKAFDGHPASSKWVRGFGSEQLALATAVAEHGSFDLLPLVYNFQPACFRLGVSEQQPKILHLFKLGKDEQMPLSRALAEIFDRRIIKWIEAKWIGRGNMDRPGAQASREERDLVLAQALGARDRALGIAADAELDSFRF
jgi:hypothetical protein